MWLDIFVYPQGAHVVIAFQESQHKLAIIFSHNTDSRLQPATN